MNNFEEKCNEITNKFLKTVSNAGDIVREKLTEGKDILETKKMLEEAREERDHLAAQIGYTFYTKYHTSNAGIIKPFQNDFAALEIVNDSIAELEDLLHAMQGIKVCPECGNEMDQCTKFCPECGTPQEIPNESDENTENFCLNCGTEFEPGQKFCKNCGYELE